MYKYNNYSDREFDELTIRWSALNSEIAAARARQKQYRREAAILNTKNVMLNLFQHLKNNACAAICSAAAVIIVFCW